MTTNTNQSEPVELQNKNPGGLTDNNMCVIAHVSALFAAVLGPFVVYLLAENNENVKEHAKAALNFNITFLIAWVVVFFLSFVLIGFVLAPFVLITWLICVIVATIKASEGVLFKYPISIQFIK